MAQLMINPADTTVLSIYDGDQASQLNQAFDRLQLD